MLKITVDDTALQKALIEAKTKLGNTKPLMAGVANLMLEAVEENFAKETDPETGQRWQELAASTKKQRAESGRGGKMLQLSGSLASSIQPRHGAINTYKTTSHSSERRERLRTDNDEGVTSGNRVVTGTGNKEYLELNRL